MDFTPIRIKTILPQKSLSFQLFIFFKEQYLKYTETGTSLENEHLEKLKKQKVAKFYIRSEDEPNYQSFLDTVLNESMDDPNVAVDDKVNLAEGTASAALDKINENPESKEAFDLTTKASKTLQKLVIGNPEALKKFYGQRAADNEVLIKHGLNTAVLCINFAEFLKLPDEDKDNLGIAGLLHDIGITRLSGPDQENFLRPFSELSAKEKQRFETHCKIGVDLLQKNPYVNEKILGLIMYHEEKTSGEGYPEHLTKLTPPQEVMSICNCYDMKVTVYGMTTKEALKSLQIDEAGQFTLELINNFKAMLKKDGM